MASPVPAVTQESLGAWLLKASPELLAVEEHVRTGFRTLTSRCVRSTYRAALVREGQPVLLWLSGHDRRHPAGLYAQGSTTGVAREDGPELAVPLALRLIDPVVTRRELLAHPRLAGIEVIRMPAGSNPSYLDVEQYAELRQAFPQVSPTGPPLLSTAHRRGQTPHRGH